MKRLVIVLTGFCILFDIGYVHRCNGGDLSCCEYNMPPRIQESDFTFFCTTHNKSGHEGDHGNCTWWCYYKASDISPSSGDAKTWLISAQAEKLLTGDSPIPGSIAVFCNMGEYGHVAYVESVNSDGSFNVTEMGYNWFNCARRKEYPAGSATGFILPSCPGYTADPTTRWHPEGTLIRGKDDPEGKIYLLQSGFKRWIGNPNELEEGPLIFNAHGFDWCKVIDVDQNEVGCFENGSNVGYPNFRLVQKSSGAESYKVFLVTENRYKRWISSPKVFEGLVYNWDDIEQISEEELNSYEELGSIYSIYPEGTLIKKEGDDRVYIISNGHKRWIKASDVFIKLGYNSIETDVIELSQTDFNSIPENPTPIDSDTISQCTNEVVHLISILGKPNGGENLPSGSTFTIEGLIQGVYEHIKIFFSNDRWRSFQELFSGTPSSSSRLRIKNTNNFTKSDLRSRFRLTDSQLKKLNNSPETDVILYSWTVPNIDSNENSVQIVAYDTAGNSLAYDVSDNLFTISPDVGCSCTVPSIPDIQNITASGNSYTVSWSDVDAILYNLQEDTSSFFTNPSLVYTSSGTSWYSGYKPSGTYYYRVKAINNCGESDWSDTKSITILGRVWPGEITNRTPSDGAINQPISVTLSWGCTHPAGENIFYDVWFSIGDELFHPPELVSVGQSGTTYTVTDLPYNTTCYWKIEIKDETGDIKISDVYQFTTIGDSTSPIGSVLINNGAATTETLSVTLYLSATDSESGVKYIRASNDGNKWSSWKYYAVKWPAWSLGDPQYGGSYVAQGTYTIYVQFKDYQGNISATYTDTIEKVFGTAGDIILNGESYQTIQNAIDAAEYGDAVYLTEGTFTYQGSQKPPRYPLKEVGIVMKAGVKLIGAGADKTTLELKYGSDAIIDADDCLIQGMTIINADPDSAICHSVKIESANSKLRDCKITTSGSDNYGIWIYNGTNNEISNNIIINNKYGIKIWGTNVKIYNNTVVDNGLTGILNNSSTSVIKNNIVTGNYRGVRVSDAIFTNNNIWGNIYENYDENDQTGNHGNISTNPLFVNPLSGDYSLSAGSPCRNTGTNVGFPYNEGTPDMGAFEYGGSGMVEVVTNRSDAAFEIIGPSGTYQGSGTYWSMSELPIGIYSIAFTSIENLYTPKYEAKVLECNQTITLDVIYSEDTIPPQGKAECFLGPVIINYGEYATADTLVDITLSFTDEVAGLGPGARMMFSNDGVSWSSPVPYSTLKKDWDFTQFGGNSDSGTKTVYVKVSDAFGNWTDPLTETILYVPNRQILVVPEEYSTIENALNVAESGDIVYILPGLYNLGNITIPQGVYLQGSGPTITTLITSIISMSSDTMIEGFTIKKWSSVVCNNHISGVIISNNIFNEGGFAIEIGNGSQVIVRNNIIDGLIYGGILLLECETSAIIKNNTIINSSKHGIELSNACSDTKIYVYNNIFANNQGYAITDSNTQDTAHRHIFSLFNTFWGNVQGDFGGINSDKIMGAGDINSNPLFVDAAASNYKLFQGSSCINSGYPEDRYNDHDDTRNDRGAYGGSTLNTTPTADFFISSGMGGTGTIFTLDANLSQDTESPDEKLQGRWDIDDNGIYDTVFSNNKIFEQQFRTAKPNNQKNGGQELRQTQLTLLLVPL